MPSQVREADAGGRLHVDPPTALPRGGPAAAQVDHVAPAPLGLGRLEASDAEQRVPQQASAPQLRTTHTHEDRQRVAYYQYVCVCVPL